MIRNYLLARLELLFWASDHGQIVRSELCSQGPFVNVIEENSIQRFADSFYLHTYFIGHTLFWLAAPIHTGGPRAESASGESGLDRKTLDVTVLTDPATADAVNLIRWKWNEIVIRNSLSPFELLIFVYCATYVRRQCSGDFWCVIDVMKNMWLSDNALTQVISTS